MTVRVSKPDLDAITFSTPSNIVTSNVPGVRRCLLRRCPPTASQGTVLSYPSTSPFTGNITWNPGTLAAGATALLSYDVAVTPTSDFQRIPVTGTPSSNGTRGQWVDETGNSAQARATFLFGPLCELAVTENSPTLALISDLRVFREAGGVLLEWETASEVGTTGFDVLRWDEAQRRWQTINREVLVTPPDASQGASYRLVDEGARGAGPWTYTFVEYEAFGGERVYGPYTLAAELGTPAPSPTRGFSREPRPGDELPVDGPPDLPAPGPSISDALKIGVREPGLTFLSADDIADGLGLTPAAVARLMGQHRLSLSNLGRPVAWREGPGGLLFYAEAIDSLYSEDNVYWLRIGQGLAMAEVSGSGLGIGTGSSSFTHTAQAEADLWPILALPLDAESDYWLWDYVIADDPVDGSKEFDILLPGVAAENGSAELRVGLQGYGPGEDGSHHAVVRINGAVVGETMWQGLERHIAVLDVDQQLLQAGVNTVEVEGLLPQGAPFSVFFVDDLELDYRRLLEAYEDRLVFSRPTAAPRSVAIDGFENPSVTVLDITDPTRPQWVQGVKVNPRGDSYRASFVSRKTAQRYLAASDEAWLVPAWVRGRPDETLSVGQNGADWVLVAPAELVDAAQSLAELRSQQGLMTRVVDLEEVMDAFNHGIWSPHAIRAFFGHAYQQWSPAPRYAVLAGPGSYDYRNIKGFGDSRMPPLMVTTPFGIFASDAAFGDVVGDDGVPEIAVGRLPATTAEELDAITFKLESYQSGDGSWTGRALLVADDPDNDVDFCADNERVANILAPSYGLDRVYLEPGGVEEARIELTRLLQAGVGFLNYEGHGAVDRLAAEGMLRMEDVAGLGNGERLPVVTALTCTVNRFELTGYPSLGETLVLEQNGGAAAVWSASGVSYHPEARKLAERFYRGLADNPGTTLGHLIRSAIAAYSGNGGLREVLDIFILIGDPAMPLLVPAAPDEQPGDEGRTDDNRP